MSESEALIRLQEIDIDILRVQKKLDSMPQLETISKIDAKIADIEDKSKQISAIRSDCEVQMQKLSDEITALKNRESELNGQLEDNADYRSVTHITKDLEGTAKRRDKVEFDYQKLVERSDKISAVEDQISNALNQLGTKRDQLTSEVEEIGKESKAKLLELKQQHDETAALISSSVLEKYEHLKDVKKGIAVGILEGSHCSACRVEFPEGKLVQLKSGPEITVCPQCHRMLVVTGE